MNQRQERMFWINFPAQHGIHNSLMDNTAIQSWFLLRVSSIKETMSPFPRVKRMSESFCGTLRLLGSQSNQSSLEIDRDVSQQSCHSITGKKSDFLPRLALFPTAKKVPIWLRLWVIIIPGEAIHLARDFGYVCETEFPARQIADYMVRLNQDTAEQYRRKDLVLATK